MTETDLPSPTIEPESARVDPPRPRPTWPTWLEILLCSGYPTQIFLMQVLVLAGLAPQLADGSLSPTFVFTVSLADTVLLLSLIVWLLIRRGEQPMQVFFGDRPAAREAAAGMASTPVIIGIVIALTVAIRRFAPALHNVPDNPLEGMLATGNVWLFLIVVIVAGGVREELQRAFLLHRFRDDFGQPVLGLVITSLSFGMGHTLQGLDAAVITGTLGAAWGLMYLTRRSALASMVSHSVFNSGELLRAFLR